MGDTHVLLLSCGGSCHLVWSQQVRYKEGHAPNHLIPTKENTFSSYRTYDLHVGSKIGEGGDLETVVLCLPHMQLLYVRYGGHM